MTIILNGTQGTTTPGLYCNTTFSGTYADGIVVDYTSTLGRISTGTTDGLAFYNGGVAVTELMRLDSSGNLGIGTSSPTQVLDIVRSTAVATQVRFKNSATANGLIIGSSAAGDSVLYNGDASNMAFYTNATERMRIDSSGNVGIGTSSPSTKLDVGSTANSGTLSTLTFSGLNSSSAKTNYVQIVPDVELNSAGSEAGGYTIKVLQQGAYKNSIVASGITNNASNYLAFSTTNEAMRIISSGNVGIGVTPSGVVRLHVQGSTTDNTAYMCVFENSSGSDGFWIRNDGYTNTGLLPASPYNATTAAAANLFVYSDGGLYRSTSSAKYKTDIKDATHGLAEVMQLRPVTYKGKSEVDSDKTFGGLIAEEVDAAGLTEFVQYADDGTPDALAYGNMVSLCIKAIQELKAELDELKAKVK